MLKRYNESNFKDEKWKTRADRCQDRIDTYEEILKNEASSLGLVDTMSC